MDLNTMTQAQWDSMTPRERDAARSRAGLTPQLTGFEGWRVEVRDTAEDMPRRFIVSRSTGWIPCHIELANRRSRGGVSACAHYFSVRLIERVR